MTAFEVTLRERAARLEADGIGTIDASLSGAESGAGPRTAKTLERAGCPTHAVRLSATDGDAAARRDTGQSQAGVPAVSRGRIGNEDSAAAADPLEWRNNKPSRHDTE